MKANRSLRDLVLAVLCGFVAFGTAAADGGGGQLEDVFFQDIPDVITPLRTDIPVALPLQSSRFGRSWMTVEDLAIGGDGAGACSRAGLAEAE